MLVSGGYPLEARELSHVHCSTYSKACNAYPMISWTRSGRVGDQYHQLSRISLLDDVGELSPASSLTIVDNINADGSGVFRIRLNDKRGSAHSYDALVCKLCSVLTLLERNRGLALQTTREVISHECGQWH